MRWWFKVNRNLLYRKYKFDPHNFILKSLKRDKSFKAILTAKKIMLKRYRKKKFKKKLKFNKRKKLTKITKIRKANIVKKQYVGFWNNIKINYFFSRKKKFRRFKKYFYWKKNKIHYLRRKLRRRVKFSITLFKRGKSKSSVKLKIKDLRKLRASKKLWLKVKRTKKRIKAWILLRINLRKNAFFYGYKNLKKFRKTNKFVNKAMPILTYYSQKLESMLNIFLIRIGLFDNIFISNNFVKYSGSVFINNKRCLYPYTCVYYNDVLKFNNIRKMQSIFKKRCMFSKSVYVRNFNPKTEAKKVIKIITNVPNYIHYDYQIMHFCIFRLPNKKEISNLLRKDKSIWALDTRLAYN